MPLTRRDLLLAFAVCTVVLAEALIKGAGVGTALVALAFLGLVVRRPAALMAVAVACAGVLANALAGGSVAVDLSSPFVAMALTCFLLGLHAHAWAPVALGVALAAGTMTGANQLAEELTYTALDDLVFFLLLLGTPAIVGRLLRLRSDVVAELAARADELRTARDEVARAAVAEERARLALGVHDALAHRVGEMSLQAAGAQRVADDEPARALDALARIEDTARAALDDIRGVIGVLRHGDDGLALAPPSAAHGPLPAAWVGSVGAVGTGTVPAAGDDDDTPVPLVPSRLDVAIAAAVFAAIAIETLTSSHLEGPGWLNVLSTAAFTAPLLVRRRAPLASAIAVFALAALHGLALTQMTYLVTSTVLLLVPAYTIAARLPRRQAIAGLVACVIGAVVLEPSELTALVGLLAWGAGRAVRDRGQRADELRATTEELERRRDAGAARARGEERLRVARELHDAVAHSMTVVVLQAGAAQRVWTKDPAAARAAVVALSDVARRTLADLRVTLRTADAPTVSDRTEAIDKLLARVRPLGLDVTVTRDDGLGVLPPALDYVAFCVIQEALTNAVRHAAPTSVRVRLALDGEEVRVEVVDAGRTSPGLPSLVEGTGTGLQGMRERVAAHGGSLEYGRSGDGFSVQARIPLPVAA